MPRRYVLVFQWIPKLWVAFVLADSEDEAEKIGISMDEEAFAMAKEIPSEEGFTRA